MMNRVFRSGLQSSPMLARGFASLPHGSHFPAVKGVMLPKGTFSGKVALVTGGGTGLGRGMAQALSSLGATVVLSSRKLDVLENAAREINAETGGNVHAVQMDVRNADMVKQGFDDIVAKAGSLPDIVINNAAGNFVSPTERLSANGWRTVIDIVLNGTALVTLEAGKRMIEAGRRGAFLNISTTYATSGSAFVTPSAAAKAGVENLTKSLSAEWSRHGLRFNCIAPGPIETKGAFSRLDPTGQMKKKMLERVGCGRLGEVEEIANLATYLVSDYASWINGTIVTFDGGETPLISGEMNPLLQVTKEQWDVMEQMIRSVKGS